jgi:tight adherence protein C
MSAPLLLPITAACAGFVSVLLLVLGISGALSSRGKLSRLEERMSGRPHRPAPRQPLRQRLAGTMGRTAATLGQRVAPADPDEMSKLALRLLRAGYPGSGAPAAFWGAKLAATVVGALIGLGGKFLLDGQGVGGSLLLTIVPAAAGLYLPDIWLSLAIKRRKQAILHALPDALDLLVVCVESGMGLDQALARVGSELRAAAPTLSGEFKTLILELRAGMKRADALRSLARRVDLEDMNSLVTLINQADTFGTSIAGTLRVYSDALRTTRTQRAEERAAKMPVKLLFPLVFFIMPALFVAIMGPAAIQLMKVFSRF